MPNKFKDSVLSIVKQVSYQTKKRSPEIFLIAGIAGFVGSAIWACVNTHKKAEKVLTNAEVEKFKIEAVHEENAITDAVQNEEIRKIYAKASWELVKTYAGPVALAGLSITSIVASHCVLGKRYAIIASTLGSVTAAFKDYRKGVIDKYGEQADYELRNGIKEITTEIPEVDENGEVTGTKTETKKTVSEPRKNDFRFLFSKDTSLYWVDDKEANLALISMAQTAMQAKLIRDKSLFLNEVFDELGMRHTKQGQVVGWLYRPDDETFIGDNFVSFGIYTLSPNGEKKFFAEDSDSPDIWIEFNCDGDILHSKEIEEVLL